MRFVPVLLVVLFSTAVACDRESSDDTGPVSDTIEEIDEAVGVDTLKDDDGSDEQPDGTDAATPPPAE